VKIRFLIMNAYAAGGTIRTTYNTAGHLAANHDVEVVSVYQRRPAARFPVDPRVRVWPLCNQVPADGDVLAHPYGESRGVAEVARRIPSVLIPSSERRYRNFTLQTDAALLRYVRSVRDGVLVSTRPGLNLAVARFGRPEVVRVGQEHMYLASHTRPLQRRIARHYPRLDLVTTLTERDAADYREMLGDRAPVMAVPNAVTPVTPRDHEAGPVVIAAGRLSPQKGFDRLIPAWSGVARRYPEWRLKIFGSGPDGDDLRSLVRRHALEGQIAMPGFTDRLADEMAAAAVFVLSSRAEGFPMVLLEAMGVGLPVVSFDCRNGPADIITDGVDGLLVPEGDQAALTAALCSLIESPARRLEMGRAARRTAQRYQLDVIGARWEQILADLVERKAHATRGER
jgi:glycosyltransferase involved in cell wall biosynthesis